MVGKAYINLADKDLVAVVDLKTRSVAARWPVARWTSRGNVVGRERHLLSSAAAIRKS